MSSCNIRSVPVQPHGSKSHYTYHTVNQLHSQLKHDSIFDNKVHNVGRETKPNHAVRPRSNQTTYTGGGKHITCPLTNKNHSINSKVGKQIISTYKKHLLSTKKEKNCSFTTIKNPATNRYVSIYGKIGRNIINNYK